MSSTTSRLGLTLPGGGSDGILPDEVQDVAVLNNNFKKIDAATGLQLVTSGTRPGAPNPGMMAKESDTGNVIYWDGATWQQLLSNLQAGLVVAGTTAARDAYWGTPGTGTDITSQNARVALVAKGARWLNTDLGWEEQYFAKVADAGAKAGTMALNPGWYPSGSGPVPEIGLAVATAGYGAGTSVITTQANVATIAKSGLGFVEPKLDGTAPGVRIIAPIEGNYRLTAYGNFNTNTINLMLKKNSVSGDATGVVAGNSGVGDNGNNLRSFSLVVPLALNDFLILAWFSSLAGGTGTDLRWSAIWDSVRTV